MRKKCRYEILSHKNEKSVIMMAIISNKVNERQRTDMKKVKITVLHKEFYPDYADTYLTDGKAVGRCPLLEVGDEFIYEGSAKMPEGFCP